MNKYTIKDYENKIDSKYKVMVHRNQVMKLEEKEINAELTVETKTATWKIHFTTVLNPQLVAAAVHTQLEGINDIEEADLVLYPLDS